MNINMKNWIAETIASPKKRAIPVLSFPAVQLMGITVRSLISSAEFQARGMKLIADRVPSGASVSLMDLSVEAECFGSQIVFSDNEVPTVTGSVIKSTEDVKALEIPKIGSCRTGIYLDAIKLASEAITDRPVLGGVIGPFSLAGRLTDVTEIMILCYENPELVHELMKKSTEFLTAYCAAYKAAGANGVVMAEPLTGMLSPDLAAEFSAPYLRRIVEALQDDNFSVCYHNCGNNTVLMADTIASVGAAMYHFGNAIKMSEILPLMPSDAIVMGNVSPSAQFRGGTPDSIRDETLGIISECAVYPNFVISSGCDIPPLSPWENTDAFFSAVTEYYENL